ncbi:hypothetical protein V8B55DRAFT_1474686 [Mucor lusitanicus]|uniref:Uncharacterized protein n=2 Tax=Mucor circinelloides f. lusitanicus TaxID=29924 RepID=A0A162ZTK8_MUCCL|nr:hypothetical protein FB192DRAFT_1375033 [Mucor lusitanicus]OAD07727.1 hypothetical protein MUCCIDRAFT_157990 [Mucor lusitanicus CBS 277.49]
MRHGSSRHPNVPSLSTLLISDPPLIVIENEDPNAASKSSPLLLSPVDSHYASSLSSSSCCSSPHLLSVSQSLLPPLQGDDPPRPLKRHPSVSSMSSSTSNGSSTTSITKPTLWHVTSPILSPSSTSFSSSFPSTATQQHKQPSAFTTQQSRSPSPVAATLERDQRPPLPPSTQIIVNEDGETILKRRRGRPPNAREPSEEGGWTFLTPTVWDVKNQQSTQGGATQDVASNQPLAAPTTTTHGDVAVFSSSNVQEDHTNALLHMPRKKRGRKPKTQMAGNSCFVWKDISSTRRSTKAMMLAQQQQKERDHLADQGSTSATATAPPRLLRRIEQAPPPPVTAASANIN